MENKLIFSSDKDGNLLVNGRRPIPVAVEYSIEEQSNMLKAKVIDTSQKSIKTVGVGQIAEFEAAFGFLWGHGKPYNELTEDEREFREIWMYVRGKAFDNMAHWTKRLTTILERIDMYPSKQTTTYINRNGKSPLGVRRS